MNKRAVIFSLYILILLFSSFQVKEDDVFTLTVNVTDLRNSTGVVQFALYNDEDSFPDEHYKRQYRILNAEIVSGASTVTFKDLPAGIYAVNILHDEDEDGEIRKGIILPREGIGFSNYQSIGFTNRPAFKRASFSLLGNKELDVKIIYLLK